MAYETIIGWAVALGVGIMIGAERERRHAREKQRSAAGLRTFAIASLLGAASSATGGDIILAVATSAVAMLAGLSYWLSSAEDKGLTTEIALITTTLLGGLSMREPQIAAGIAVVLTALLASRTALHRFVNQVLTEDELYHALMFAAVTLVILPLVPDQRLGPFGAINPRSIWMVVILVIAISAAGYVLVRLLGSTWGLPLAGFASGFISSTATIGAMASRSTASPETMKGAVAGAMLSTVATVVQMAAVLAATSWPTLEAMALPLLLAGVVAVAYAARFTVGALREVSGTAPPPGEPFSLKAALLFAATLAAILVLAAGLRQWFGTPGAAIAAAVGGFVDTHSAAISVASLVAAAQLQPSDAVLPILAAFTTNTASKIAAATAAGQRDYAFKVVPGLVLVTLAAWAGAFIPLFR